jgi:hypothetical protein
LETARWRPLNSDGLATQGCLSGSKGLGRQDGDERAEENGATMIKWFAEYKDVIAGLAGIATAIGLLITSFALVVAAIQIREQRQLNRAHAMYEIQRDARELTGQLMGDPVLAGAVFGTIPNKQNVAIGTVINYYSAAFQLWQHGVLDDHLWELLANDFAKMLAVDQPQKQWNATKEGFDSRFRKDIESRIQGAHTRELS